MVCGHERHDLRRQRPISGGGFAENATPLADVAFLTLVINFRHLVYGLSMLEKFKGMGWRKLYMIFSLTDETYALLAGVRPPDGVDEKKFYFTIALLDQAYWIAGSLAGAVAGSLITINTEGAGVPALAGPGRRAVPDPRSGHPGGGAAAGSAHAGQI